MSTPNTPNAPMTQNAAKKSGLPCGLIAAGCGCLTLLLLLVVGVGGYFMFSSASSAVEEEGGIMSMIAEQSGLGDMLPPGVDDGKGGAASERKSKGNKKGGMSAEKRAAEEKEEAISMEKVRSYMTQPMTKKDIKEHHKFLSDWKKNPAQINYVKQMKNAEKLGDEKEDSVAGSLKKVNAGAKVMSAMKEVTEAFDEHIKKNGGYEKYYGRVIRIGGVVAASDTVKNARKNLKDPNSDAVAARMLKERPEVAREYRKNFEEAKKEIAKAKKSGKKDSNAGFGALMTMGQGPGTVALARMPEKSFQTWKSLSVKERKKIREALNPKDIYGYGGWFGFFSVNPAALLVAASMAELEELQQE